MSQLTIGPVFPHKAPEADGSGTAAAPAGGEGAAEAEQSSFPSRPSLLVLSLLCPPGQRGSLGCAGRDCPFLLGRGRQEQAWGLEESEGTKSQGMHRPLREDPKVQPALEIPAVPEGNGEPCASLRQRTCSD